MTQTRDIVYLAALLHDIGKFWQWADERGVKSSSERDSLRKKLESAICPTRDGRNTHKHVVCTAQFFKESQSLFEGNSDVFDRDVRTRKKIVRWACYTLNIVSLQECIFQLADHRSSGIEWISNHGFNDETIKNKKEETISTSIKRKNFEEILKINPVKEYVGYMEQEDYDKARFRIKERYDIDLKVAEDLLDTEGLWGVVTRFAKIILSHKAVLGTDFHEEFHIVTQFALTPEQRERLYKESGQTEEQLAEDYRYYALGMEKKGFIKEMFDTITNFLKSIFGADGSNEFKREVFQNIYEGKYKLQRREATFDHYSKAVLTEAEISKYFEEGMHVLSNFISATGGNYAKGDSRLGLIATLNNGKLLTKILNDKKYVGTLMGKDTVDIMRAALYRVGKTHNVLTRMDVTPGLLNRFKIYASNQLKATVDDVELEIYERAGDEKGKDSFLQAESNEVNHFEKAQSKLRLFLYNLTTPTGGIYGLDNALNKIYQDFVNISDSKEFFDLIRTSEEKFYVQLKEKLLLGEKVEDKVQQNNVHKFQNVFYSQLAKLRNEYMMLKVEQINGKPRVYWINATKEKHRERLIDRYYSTINKNFTKGKLNKDNYRELFEDLNIYLPKFTDKQLVKNQNQLETVYHFITTTLIKHESGSKKASEKRSELRGNLGKLAEIELSVTENKSVYNIYNAGGKPVFTIQNFHGLSKIYPNNNIYPLNGLQSDLYESSDSDFGKPTIVDKDTVASKLGKIDMNNMYLNAVLSGITPYTFAGDKSTLWGVELTSSIPTTPNPNEIKALEERLKTIKEAYKKWVKTGDIEQAIITDSSIKKLEERLENVYWEVVPLTPSKMSKRDFIGTKLRPMLEVSYSYQLEIFNNGYNNEFMSFFKTEEDDKINFRGLTKEEVDEIKKKKYKYYVNNRNKLISEAIQDIEDRAVAKEKYFTDNRIITQLKDSEGNDLYNNYPFFTYEALYSMGQLEMTRNGTGDLAYYKDPAKRLYGLTSAKSNIRHDEAYIKEYNELHGTNIGNHTKSLILKDVEITTDLYPDLEVNGTDAQGYMNYDSYVFMMRSSGMFDENAEELHKVIKNSKDVVEVEAAYKEIEAYQKVIKPQGFGFNEKGHPVFYKLSVIPLDKHLTKGKNLDNIRKLMDSKNLDIVMFESAVKVGGKSVHNMYDENGDYNTNLEQQVTEDPDAIHLLEWKWYNIQVETSNPHEKVTSGTQFRKQMFVDLKPDAIVNGLNKQQIVMLHDELMNEKTDGMLKALKEKLQINNKFELDNPEDISKIKSTLLREAVNRGLPIDFQTHIEKLTKFDLISGKEKLEAIILKMIDMSKHKMFGDMKVQVSSVGFEAQGGNIKTSRDLQYVDGKMEIYLPFEYKDYYANSVVFNPKTNIYELKEGVELPTMISYRIPTQYLNSIDRTIVKGFLPEMYGNAVVVPFEITTKTGSDFDINKLFIYYPAFKVNFQKLLDTTLLVAISISEKIPEIVEYLQYSYNIEGSTYNSTKDKVVLYELYKNNNPKNAIEKQALDWINDYIEKYRKNFSEYDVENVDNKLMNLYNDILTHQKELVLKPDNQDIINPIFDAIQKAKGVSTYMSRKDYLDPTKVINKRNGFLSAKDTLGIQNINSSSHAICQMYDVGIKDVPINIMVKKALTEIPKLSTLLESFKNVPKPRGGVLPLNRIENVNGEFISQIFSQTIGSTVDVARDDRISAVNFNPETTKVVNLLIRSGVSTEEIFYLINNTAVVDYINRKHNNKSGSVLDKDYSVYDHIAFKSGKVDVVKNLKADLESAESRSILTLYKNLEHHGDLLDKFNKVITFDTKGVGTTVSENLFITEQFKMYEEQLLGYFSNFNRVFQYTDSSGKLKETFLGKFKTLANNTRNLTDVMFPLKALLRENGIKTVRDIIDSKDSQVKKVRDIATREARVATYLIQQKLTNTYPGLKREVKAKMLELKAMHAKAVDKYTNKLLEDLIFNVEDGKEVVSLYGGAALNSEESNFYTRSWLELYDRHSKEALMLAVKSYFQSGTINSPITMYNVMPYEIKKVLGTVELDFTSITDIEKLLLDAKSTKIFGEDYTKNIKDNEMYNETEEDRLYTLAKTFNVNKNGNTSVSYTDEQIKKGIECFNVFKK